MFETPDGDTLNVPARPASGRYWSPDGRPLARRRFPRRRDEADGRGARRSRVGQVPHALLRGGLRRARPVHAGRLARRQVDRLRPAGCARIRKISGSPASTSPAPRRLTRVNPELEGYVYGKTQLIDWKAGDTRAPRRTAASGGIRARQAISHDRERVRRLLALELALSVRPLGRGRRGHADLRDPRLRDAPARYADRPREAFADVRDRAHRAARRRSRHRAGHRRRATGSA